MSLHNDNPSLRIQWSAQVWLTLPPPPFQWTAEPIRGDGSSWIMHALTQVLIWKWIPDQYWLVYLKQKKRTALNPLRSLQSEVSRIIRLYCESERGGGLLWPSSLNTAPLQSALTVIQGCGALLKHVIVFSVSLLYVADFSPCLHVSPFETAINTGSDNTSYKLVIFKDTQTLTDDRGKNNALCISEWQLLTMHLSKSWKPI